MTLQGISFTNASRLDPNDLMASKTKSMRSHFNDFGQPSRDQSKLEESYGIGAKLLGKMGYKPGQGLGASGAGIVEPIQQKMRPSLLGVGGQSEKIDVSSDQDEPKDKRSLHVIRSALRKGLALDIDLVQRALRTANDQNWKTLGDLVAHWQVFKDKSTELETSRVGIETQSSALDSPIEAKLQLMQLLEVPPQSTDELVSSLLTLQEHFPERDDDSIGPCDAAVALLKDEFRVQISHWNLLDSSGVPMLGVLKALKPVLLGTQISDLTVYSPYVNLLGTTWLPKLGQTISTSWDEQTNAAVLLAMEEWDMVLPSVIRQSILTRLVVPRLESHFSHNPVTSHKDILPWLSYLGPSLANSVARFVLSYLESDAQSFDVRLQVASDWRDLLDSKWIIQFAESAVKTAIPGLNFSRCDLVFSLVDPLELFLDTRFFPVWKACLINKLADPTPDYQHIAQWYQSWSDYLRETQLLDTVEPHLKTGLAIINDAMDGCSAAELKNRHSDKQSHQSSAKQYPNKSNRETLEDYCLQNGLLFTDLGRLEPTLHIPLYRISRDGGIAVDCYVTPKSILFYKKPGMEQFAPIALDALRAYI